MPVATTTTRRFRPHRIAPGLSEGPPDVGHLFAAAASSFGRRIEIDDRTGRGTSPLLPRATRQSRHPGRSGPEGGADVGARMARGVVGRVAGSFPETLRQLLGAGTARARGANSAAPWLSGAPVEDLPRRRKAAVRVPTGRRRGSLSAGSLLLVPRA